MVRTRGGGNVSYCSGATTEETFQEKRMLLTLPARKTAGCTNKTIAGSANNNTKIAGLPSERMLDANIIFAMTMEDVQFYRSKVQGISSTRTLLQKVEMCRRYLQSAYVSESRSAARADARLAATSRKLAETARLMEEGNYEGCWEDITFLEWVKTEGTVPEVDLKKVDSDKDGNALVEMVLERVERFRESGPLAFGKMALWQLVEKIDVALRLLGHPHKVLNCVREDLLTLAMLGAEFKVMGIWETMNFNSWTRKIYSPEEQNHARRCHVRRMNSQAKKAKNETSLPPSSKAHADTASNKPTKHETNLPRPNSHTEVPSFSRPEVPSNTQPVDKFLAHKISFGLPLTENFPISIISGDDNVRTLLNKCEVLYCKNRERMRHLTGPLSVGEQAAFRELCRDVIQFIESQGGLGKIVNNYQSTQSHAPACTESRAPARALSRAPGLAESHAPARAESRAPATDVPSELKSLKVQIEVTVTDRVNLKIKRLQSKIKKYKKCNPPDESKLVKLLKQLRELEQQLQVSVDQTSQKQEQGKTEKAKKSTSPLAHISNNVLCDEQSRKRRRVVIVPPKLPHRGSASMLSNTSRERKRKRVPVVAPGSTEQYSLHLQQFIFSFESLMESEPGGHIFPAGVLLPDHIEETYHKNINNVVDSIFSRSVESLHSFAILLYNFKTRVCMVVEEALEMILRWTSEAHDMFQSHYRGSYDELRLRGSLTKRVSWAKTSFRTSVEDLECSVQDMKREHNSVEFWAREIEMETSLCLESLVAVARIRHLL